MSIKRIYFLDFLQYEFDFSIYVDYNSVKEKGGARMFQYYKLFDYMKLRNNENVNTSVLAALCDYLKCDITDIMEYVQPNEQEQ